MSFELSIHTDNDAARSPEDLAVMLERAAAKLRIGDEFTGRIRDVNGNTVGAWDANVEIDPVEHMVPTVTQLQQRLVAAKRETREAQAETAREVRAHRDFLTEFGREAMELADEHGWCEVAEKFLRDQGVPIPQKRFEATVTLTVRLSGRYTGGGEPSRGDVKYALTTETSGDDVTIELDSDWEDVVLTNVEVDEVTDVDRVSN